eukprot:EG_transcript_24297
MGSLWSLCFGGGARALPSFEVEPRRPRYAGGPNAGTTPITPQPTPMRSMAPPPLYAAPPPWPATAPAWRPAGPPPGPIFVGALPLSPTPSPAPTFCSVDPLLPGPGPYLDPQPHPYSYAYSYAYPSPGPALGEAVPPGPTRRVSFAAEPTEVVIEASSPFPGPAPYFFPSTAAPALESYTVTYYGSPMAATPTPTPVPYAFPPSLDVCAAPTVLCSSWQPLSLSPQSLPPTPAERVAPPHRLADSEPL